MQTASLPFRDSSIGYRYSVAGQKLLLCFHGYAESGESFEFLEEELNGYSFMCIDLPHHGATDWRETRDPDLKDFVEIIRLIRQKHFNENSRLSLLSFSMGGRLAFSVVQAGVFQFERVVLLAPDGIKMNFWYWFATHTLAGNRLFRFTVRHPGWIFSCLRLGNRMKLINHSVFKFTRHHLQSERARLELYYRWTSLRNIRPALAEIRAQIEKKDYVLHLVYGEYDRIIKYEQARKFKEQLGKRCTMHIIPCGHQVLQKKNASFIAQLLQTNDRLSSDTF